MSGEGAMDFRIINPLTSAQAAQMMTAKNPLTTMLATDKQMGENAEQELKNAEMSAKLPYAGDKEKASIDYMNNLGAQASATAQGTGQQNAIQSMALLGHAAEGLKSLPIEQRNSRWPQLRTLLQTAIPNYPFPDATPTDQELEEVIQESMTFLNSVTANPTGAAMANGSKIPTGSANARTNDPLYKIKEQTKIKEYNEAGETIKAAQTGKNQLAVIENNIKNYPNSAMERGMTKFTNFFGTPSAEMTSINNIEGATQFLKGAQKKDIVGNTQVSDSDMKILDKGLGLTGTDRETLAFRASVLKAGMQANEDNALAKQKWIDMGGDTSDFNALWADYANNNRIYNDDGTTNTQKPTFFDWAKATHNIDLGQQIKSGQQAAAQPASGQSSLFAPTKQAATAATGIDPALQKRIDALSPELKVKFGFSK